VATTTLSRKTTETTLTAPPRPNPLVACEKSVENGIKYAKHLHLAFNKTNKK